MSINKVFVVVTIASFLFGVGISRYFWPVQSKTEVIEKEVVRNDIKTIVRTVERPDGSRETVSEITDRSQTNASRSDTKIVVFPKNWQVGAGVHSDYKLMPTYSVHVHRRILGPVLVGLQGNTNGQIGLLVSVEF